MVDITPLVPAGRQVVDSYGPGVFRVSGVLYEGSVLVFPERTLPWAVADPGGILAASVETVVAHRPEVELLLIGCGPRIVPIDPEARRELRMAGIGLDLMDTGAACRTYNILLAEDRRVAAALIAL